MSNIMRMFGQMANSAMTSATDAQKQRQQAYNREQSRNYSPYKPNMGRQSVEEYNMIRQMELQARRDAQQVIFEQEAAKDRRESNRILSLMLKNLQEDTQQQKDDAKWNYFGI